MRDIKARVWDYEEEKMLELITIGCSREDRWGPLYIKNNIINGLYDNNGDHHDNYVIMQWIGRTDKNGTDIYEGDVVRCPWDSKKFQVVRYNLEYLGYTPFITDGGCGCCSDDREVGWRPESSEVIGNIYQSPALLIFVMKIEEEEEEE